MNVENAKENGSSSAKSWDEFVELANELIDSGNLKEWEVDYKRNLGREFADARSAVLGDAQDWVSRLKIGLRSRPGHPLTWRTIDDVKKWVDSSPEDARKALKVLWTENDSPVVERIRRFNHDLPGEPHIRGSTGTRMRLISTLLMGLDETEYPPFGIRTFQSAYRRTGFEEPRQGEDEASLYEHALYFLDRLIEQAQAHGVQLHHRLDAQSVVWQLVNELPELDDTPPPLFELHRKEWTEFAKLYSELIESGLLDEKEIKPKLEVGRMFAKARESVLSNAEGWHGLVKAGVSAAAEKKPGFQYLAEEIS